jgi:hypothetical protein
MSCPQRIHCQNGRLCLTAQGDYVKAWNEWRDGGAVGPEPPATRVGKQYRITTAVTVHKAGWLDCGHFVCSTPRPDILGQMFPREDARSCIAQHHLVCRECRTNRSRRDTILEGLHRGMFDGLAQPELEALKNEVDWVSQVRLPGLSYLCHTLSPDCHTLSRACHTLSRACHTLS